MKKTVALAIVLCAATAGAGALDPRTLDSQLEESVVMWEQVVPWSRLGKAPALESWDPAALVKRIAADLGAAGRYKEFAYLFEYLQRRAGARMLELRVIRDRTPTPGFWPARLSETRRAIVISDFDLEALAGDDRLLRSSFIRALATLYYIDEEPALNALWRSRNVLNEYSAFMTGIWLESVYLNEILHVTVPRDPAPDWYRLLLGSAGADNLATASDRLFLVDMEHAYGIVQELRAVTAPRQAQELLDRLKVAPGGLREDVERAVYGTFPTPRQIMRGTLARTIVMLHPWALLSLYRALPATDRALAGSMDQCLAFLRSFSSIHRYFDPQVVAERQKFINTLVFRPAEPGAPGAASPYAPNPADAPASLPGAASERWYRWCDKPDPFSFEGMMPVSAAEAAGIAAYRFSSDGLGRLVGVEYFVKGKPRSSGTLMYAFRISVERGGDTETWRWESPHGGTIVNESGYGIMRVLTEGDDSTMTFFMPDGRRAQDESGAWSVTRRMTEGGYELRFLDGSGLPWAGGYGYAIDRRTLMSRLSHDDRQGEAFGLFATTGRAVSFLAPAAWAIFVGTFSPIWGIIGLVVIILAGFLLLMTVRVAEFVMPDNSTAS